LNRPGEDTLADLGTDPVAPNRATPDALRAHLKAEIDNRAPIIGKFGSYADEVCTGCARSWPARVAPWRAMIRSTTARTPFSPRIAAATVSARAVIRGEASTWRMRRARLVAVTLRRRASLAPMPR